MNKINFKELKNELIFIYEEFLKNPENKDIQKEAKCYETQFGGLSTYNDYLKSEPIPKNIEKALNWLSALYQYGLWGEKHELSDEKIIYESKEILKNLKEDK